MGTQAPSKSVRTFADLRVYRRLFDLHLRIHHATMGFPRFELFELGSQLRRSSNSIAANLAESWNNRHSSIYVEGINRAQGELRETLHHLAVAKAKKYLSEKEFGDLRRDLDDCGGMLHRLRLAIQRQRIGDT
jgi:four helix bundle protein